MTAIPDAASAGRILRMADQLAVMMVHCDSERRLTYANRSYLEFIGHTAEDALGASLATVLGPEAYARIRGHVDEALEGRSVDFQVALTRDGAPTRHLSAQYRPELDNDGRVVGFFATIVDESERFRTVFDSQTQLAGLLSPDGVLIEVNQTALDAAGVDRTEVVGRPFWDTPWWAHNTDLQGQLKAAVDSAGRGEYVRFEASHPTPEGDLIWVDFALSPISDEGGQVSGIVAEGHEITRRVEAAEELRLSNERFRHAFDFAPIGMALVGPQGKWLRVNRAICEIVGYEAEELLRIDFQTITHPDDLDADLGHVQALLDGEEPHYQMLKRYIHKEGRQVHVLLAVSLVRDNQGEPLYFIAQIQDVTARMEARERLEASLAEKEVLLREIHHRVKNNLQIVSTLLDLQSDQVKDPVALGMFREAHDRVRSMALIHERLYRSEDLSGVDFSGYVERMVSDLLHAYRKPSESVRLNVEVEVPPLPIDTAIPCGLMLNELITNVLKHAFLDGEGSLTVRLVADGDRVILSVADDGVGLPTGIGVGDAASFGLQLIETLTHQLRGTVAWDTAEGEGTRFTATFPAWPERRSS